MYDNIVIINYLQKFISILHFHEINKQLEKKCNLNSIILKKKPYSAKKKIPILMQNNLLILKLIKIIYQNFQINDIIEKFF